MFIFARRRIALIRYRDNDNNEVWAQKIQGFATWHGKVDERFTNEDYEMYEVVRQGKEGIPLFLGYMKKEDFELKYLSVSSWG